MESSPGVLAIGLPPFTPFKAAKSPAGIAPSREPGAQRRVIGYCLNKAYWSMGYGTDAAAALLEFGFTRLALHRIYAMCDPSNIGSNRVLEKAGMRLERRLREDYPVRGK